MRWFCVVMMLCCILVAVPDVCIDFVLIGGIESWPPQRGQASKETLKLSRSMIQFSASSQSVKSSRWSQAKSWQVKSGQVLTANRYSTTSSSYSCYSTTPSYSCYYSSTSSRPLRDRIANALIFQICQKHWALSTICPSAHFSKIWKQPTDTFERIYFL